MTWLQQADRLLAAAREAQLSGDHVAVVALACRAAECVQVHKDLEAAQTYLAEVRNAEAAAS